MIRPPLWLGQPSRPRKTRENPPSGAPLLSLLSADWTRFGCGVCFARAEPRPAEAKLSHVSCMLLVCWTSTYNTFTQAAPFLTRQPSQNNHRRRPKDVGGCCQPAVARGGHRHGPRPDRCVLCVCMEEDQKRRRGGSGSEPRRHAAGAPCCAVRWTLDRDGDRGAVRGCGVLVGGDWSIDRLIRRAFESMH